jgi:hypothetical protein
MCAESTPPVTTPTPSDHHEGHSAQYRFPEPCRGVKIEYVTEDDLRARHRSLKHDIPVFIMRPIGNEGNEGNHSVIGFTRYWFSSTKKTNAMGLEGGYRVVMAYDCARKEYVVEVQSSGGYDRAETWVLEDISIRLPHAGSTCRVHMPGLDNDRQR